MRVLQSLSIVAMLGVALLVPPAMRAADIPASLVRAVTAVNVTVSDTDRSTRFYCDVLGFEKVEETRASGREFESLTGLAGASARVVRLRLGAETLLLTDFEGLGGRPMPTDSRGNDRWFQHLAIVVSDVNAAAARLREHGVALVSEKPQRLPAWNPNAAGIAALYFRDPDGHYLEVIEFPADKGDPRWHEPSKRLFLGIDHTAIVVADTDTSLKFYRDDLGLRVVGGSENYGPEQERLNGVPGAHLRITALRSPQGPGVELLEYLSPRDGRPRSLDARPNDLWHWQIEMAVSEVQTCSETCSGRAALANDPDGHVVQLTAVGTEE